MQSSRALLSLPSSSGSSLVSSRTSSSASLLRAHEYGGELESYLSLVAGERKKRSRKEGKAEKRGAAEIDWGRLLDGEEIQNQEEVEAEESEEYGDIKQFLKPMSAPIVSSEKTKKDAEGPAELSNQPPNTLPKLLSRAADGDLTYSMSMTDSFSGGSIASEPDLALSSHFRNNIFTLEQLETLDSEPDHNSKIGATGRPDKGGSATSEDIAPEDGRQFHNIVSLADLDSLPAESKTKLPDAVNVPSELVVHHRYSEQDRNSSEEQKSDDLHSTSEEINQEDTETSVRYDEDFEDETVGTTALSHSSLDNQKSLDSGASSHNSLNRDRPAVEHSSPDKQGSMESIDKSLYWERSEDIRSGERTQSEQTTTVCGPGSRNETAPGTSGSGGVTTSQQQVFSTGAPRDRARLGDLHQGSGEPPYIKVFSSSSHVSDALEDLVRSQLALTRSLVDRSRSLAQYLTDSITPDYHYTTLEDTKKYISQHRPTILTKEEAQKLVSKEEEL
ncbi:Uncharacterized protein C19orf44 [Geodia barretti]|uniref:Uncharacterized protein C19orf44 n=1 Tax=Geodia barretti TaxID=519541 RepID=A0AA35QR35_GEOBA|nr:Uncharacterized protein C19orf44 [Geodia barretti]